MRSCDVLIVGGGPAGSTAAWRLRRAGVDVLVLDRERFPRLRVHLGRLHLPVPCVQHSIRRFEFDAWLLERSRAPVEQHNVRHIRAENGGYIVDEAFRCRYLIGAGASA